LRRCGADVVICGRREEVLAARAAELELSHVAGDVRDDADAERIVRFAL
jgi:NADP-dependent 3-hydroxy acid dehydrogenase YdfG